VIWWPLLPLWHSRVPSPGGPLPTWTPGPCTTATPVLGCLSVRCSAQEELCPPAPPNPNQPSGFLEEDFFEEDVWRRHCTAWVAASTVHACVDANENYSFLTEGTPKLAGKPRLSHGEIRDFCM